MSIRFDTFTLVIIKSVDYYYWIMDTPYSKVWMYSYVGISIKIPLKTWLPWNVLNDMNWKNHWSERMSSKRSNITIEHIS